MESTATVLQPCMQDGTVCVPPLHGQTVIEGAHWDALAGATIS